MKLQTVRCPFLFLIAVSGALTFTGCTTPIGEGYIVDPKLPTFGSLRLDANPERTYITVYDENGRRFAGAARLSKSVSGTISGGSRAIPKSLHVTWSTGPCELTNEGVWTRCPLMGDYTAPVAERIPADVLDYVRQHGGGLRLKIRVGDGAVLVGWDIEHYVPSKGWKPGDGDTGFHYTMIGGDFREDQIVDGKVVEPGWEHAPPSPPSTQ